MLLFGNLVRLPGTPAQVMSRWLDRFEQAGYEVSREDGGRLAVLVPGWDPGFGAFEEALAAQRVFWDRMIVDFDEHGGASFRFVYFTPLRIFMHAAVAAIFVLDSAALQGGPLRCLVQFALFQSVPWLVTLASFAYTRRRISLEAAPATG